MDVEERDIPAVERVLALRALPEFEALTHADLALVADVARPRHFAGGELLMRPGVPMYGLHFLLDGAVRLEPAREPARTLHAREVVGDLASLFRDAPAPRVTTLEPSTTLELGRADLEEVFEDDFPIFLGVLRALARSLARRTPAFAEPTPGSVFAARAQLATPLALVDRIVLLRRSMDFAGAEIEALAELGQQASELRVSAGRTLWRAEEPADHFVVVVDGTVHASAGTELLPYGPGATLGALESLALEPRAFTLTAQTDLRGLRLDTRVLLDLIEDSPAVGLNLLRSIARRIGAR